MPTAELSGQGILVKEQTVLLPLLFLRVHA
jgi:hypothetical protein